MIFGTEDISAFYVAMQNVNLMEGTESFGHLYERLPDLRFTKISMIAPMLIDLLLHIASISKLHHNTQTLSWVIKKCLLIINNIRMRN